MFNSIRDLIETIIALLFIGIMFGYFYFLVGFWFVPIIILIVTIAYVFRTMKSSRIINENKNNYLGYEDFFIIVTSLPWDIQNVT